MEIAACRTYHAITSSVSALSMQDGRSAFKVYYISIIGREQPELYEWERCARTREEFERVFVAGAHEGIGFVTAFPHIAKIFRFAPSMETVLDIREFDTAGMRPKDCARGDGYHEFACYAEAAIAAEEYHAWAQATTVAEYLGFRCDRADFPLARNGKLAQYWNAQGRTTNQPG